MAKTDWTPKRIRLLRLALGWDTAQAAAQLGITRRQWQNWEAGTRGPSATAAILLDQHNSTLPKKNRV